MSSSLKKTLTYILAGGQGERLYPLTRDRAKPAVPFAGIYRVIDFTLSNCLNSDLRKIEVLTQYKSLSLSRHLKLGWNIFNNDLGEYIYDNPPQQRVRKTWYMGTADAIYQNIYSMDQVKPVTVLILSGDHIYKIDYRKMIAFHLKKKADVTVGSFVVPRSKASSFGIIEKDRDDRVIGFQEKPTDPKTVPGDPEHSLVSMGIYAFNAEALVKRLCDDAKSAASSHDFGKDVIPSMVANKDRVFVYSARGGTGGFSYWRDIGTLDAYWDAHMDLLEEKPEFDLFSKSWPIHTYTIPYAPPLVRRSGAVDHSILANGCMVDGAVVRRCVLSPGVHIDRGAEVTDSVILSNVHIGAGARIHRAIIDKNVKIPRGSRISPDTTGDGSGFTVTKGGVIVIPKEQPM